VPVAVKLATVGDDEQKLWLAAVGAEVVPHGLMEKSSIPIPSSEPDALKSNHLIIKEAPLAIDNPVITSEMEELCCKLPEPTA